MMKAKVEREIERISKFERMWKIKTSKEITKLTFTISKINKGNKIRKPDFLYNLTGYLEKD